MCGITGIITKQRLTEENGKSVALMNKELFHRGPNSAGGFSYDHISAAMRRLSIIDVSGGDQPLYNEDKTIVLIANGEIYNFVELRETLENAGHIFSTKSDCETIIHAYEEYGEKFIEKLRGMFAFCLYDTKKHKAIIARDRLGEKPLYLFQNESMLAFSSEFKSIVTLIPKEDRKILPESINLFFHYQFIPEPMTMIEGVTKLERATMLIIDIKTFSIKKKVYWNMEDAEKTSGASLEPKKVVRGILDDVEKIIIRSDVPIGVCLSGGIDSSAIASLSQKYSDKKIHAFTVSYPESPENDEKKYAMEFAQGLGMDFHTVEIHKEQFSRDFSSLIAAMDDPIADIAGYGYYRLSKAAREQNVPVLFAGFGGDELFWGYEWLVNSVVYNKLKENSLKSELFVRLLKKNKSQFKKHPFSTLSFVFKAVFLKGYIFYELTPGFSSTHMHYNKIFTSNFRSQVNSAKPFSFFKNLTRKNPEIQSCVLLYDLWMAGNCIPLGDRTSMAHSVELRLPLLDYSLIEQVLAMRKTNPGDYKLGYKHWLIQALQDVLPHEIISRKKRGFTPPTTLWIQELVDASRNNLLEGYLIKQNIINKSFVENMLSDVRANKDFLYKMLVLEKWISLYVYV